ncbi:MAG: SEC-C metal-binding domain-containing protein [Pseudomonadota bacterium]
MNIEHTLHDYSEVDLARLDEAALLALLENDLDTAPRGLIDACAARGDAMVAALQRLSDEPCFWGEVSDGRWWMRYHMAAIAGLIPSEEAGRLLVALMRHLDGVDSDMQDWLAGYWPALFANKPESVVDLLRELALDRKSNVYIRSNAAQPVIASAQQRGEAELETALDWLAAIVEDESEEWQLRLNLSMDLLDFPRERYRLLLQSLAKRQVWIGRAYDQDGIDEAYSAGIDQPEWERFANPWKFYEPAAIAERQRRWAGEAEEDFDFLPPWQEPYIRPEAKIGRNDPCPCGSGKKYKKCCLN